MTTKYLILTVINVLLIYKYFKFLTFFFTYLASDNDETETAAIEKQFNEQEAAQQEAEQAEFEQEEETTRASSKLPSFKKKSRENNEEERARLEEVRREIREMKKSTSRDDDEQDKPVDPQQGLFVCLLVFRENTEKIAFHFT